MATITNLTEFQAAARAIPGAEVETRPTIAGTDSHTRLEFRAWKSMSEGGCGSDGCRCSPGLWVSGSQNGQLVLVHFGSDWERGGEGWFSEADRRAWRKFARAAGAV